MIHTEEDDEFERIAHEIEIKKGQPYYFQDHTTDLDKLVYRKPSRNFDDDDIQDYVRPWVGLTDAEVDQAFTELTLRKIYQAIEAKLKEKNT
jgi:uncharacterized protein (DUF433 family)